MIRIVSVLSAVVLGATAVMAQNLAPIKERQEIMKKISDDNKILTGMAKGEAAYDGAKVTSIITGWEGALKKVPDLFPDDSKTGEKTRAKAEIWQDKADFKAKLDEFSKAIADTKSKTASADGFKASMTALNKSCDNCHEKYRAPRDRAS